MEGGDGLASVAEMLAGLTAAARAGGLDDTAALTALAAARRIAPGLRRTQGSVRPMQDEHPSVRYPDPSVRLNSGESRGWTYIGTGSHVKAVRVGQLGCPGVTGRAI